MRFLKFIIWLIIFAAPVGAQPGQTGAAAPKFLGNKASDPASCAAAVFTIYYNTTLQAPKYCSAANTWSLFNAGLASPALTGAPTAPTAATGTNTSQIATTAFVQQESLLTNTFYSSPTVLPTVLKSSIYRLNTSNLTFTDSGVPVGTTLYLFAVSSGAYFQWNNSSLAFYLNNFSTFDAAGSNYGRYTAGAGGGSLIMIKLASDTYMIYVKTGTWTFSAG